jgi:hypothetical protein
MPSLPQGSPYLDVLAPPGSAALARELETKLQLAGLTGWRVVVDDGTMERSPIPLGPLREGYDRIWVGRTAPSRQGNPLEEAVTLAVEFALALQAPLVSVGVFGTLGTGFVLFDDPRMLYGLALLEWLYNPRLGTAGDVLQQEPADPEAQLGEKAARFPRLFTAAAASRARTRLPAQAIQQVETHFALSLLTPDGMFDPRMWQSLALRLVLPEVQALAGQPAALGAPGGPAPKTAPKPPEPPKPAAPSDGLSPLARARLEAERRARSGEAPVAPPPKVEADVAGPGLRWTRSASGPLLVVPAERLDGSMLDALRAGNLDGLPGRDQPDSAMLDGWLAAGAPFVSEVPFLSRLFVDNRPAGPGDLDGIAPDAGGVRALDVLLPRIARVRAFVAPRPDGKRRIAVASGEGLDAPSVFALLDGVG